MARAPIGNIILQLGYVFTYIPYTQHGNYMLDDKEVNKT